MSKDPELEAMQAVFGVLAPLEQDARTRVLRWAADKLGVEDAPASRTRTRSGDAMELAESDGAISEGLHPRVGSWMRQNGVTESHLDQVFFRSGDQVEIVAAEIPGKTTKERVLNIYLLAGVGRFLTTGAATFDDAFGRELCRAAGCLDTTNHTKILADKGNAFGGSKERGWTLTQPGMKQAANLIKDIGGAD